MASPQINKLIVNEGKYFSGLSDTNHISQYLNDYSPEKFSQLMTQLFAHKQLLANPLLEMTEGRNKVMYLDTSDSWTWDIALSGFNPLIVVENKEASNSQAGIDGLPFLLKLDKNWFTNGDVISADKRKTKVRVGDEPILQESDGFVYTCYLLTKSPGTDFVNQKYFKPGTEWIRLFSVYPERASQFSKIWMTPTAKMVDHLPDHIRIEHEITGYADKRTIEVATASYDKNGNFMQLTNPRWFKRAEVEFWKHYYAQVEGQLMWSPESSNLKGESGYNLRTTDGLWHKLDYGNVYPYSKFSIKLLEDFLLSIFFGRVEGKDRNVVLMTGEWGMQLFHRAIREEAGKFGLFISSDKAIKGSGMDMGFGMQFTEYYMINGGKLTLKYMPSLDVQTTNIEKGAGLYPETSATFIIMDLSGDYADNVKLVKHRDSEEYGYQIGTASPFGPMKGGISSTPIDGYSMWAKTRVGLHVTDLSRTAKLVMETA